MESILCVIIIYYALKGIDTFERRHPPRVGAACVRVSAAFCVRRDLVSVSAAVALLDLDRRLFWRCRVLALIANQPHGAFTGPPAEEIVRRNMMQLLFQLHERHLQQPPSE
jgi:hypothetical protein